MDRAIQAWLSESNTNSDELGPRELKLSYTVYGCMLLLSSTSFESPAWQAIRGQKSEDKFRLLYALIARHLKVTHIAVTKPIPLNNDESTENVLRSPSNFHPLYGDFGSETARSPPTQSDFHAAFWVTAKQNGIFQTWAPRWTMFSRGNISEKARILSLPSVQDAVEQGTIDGRGCAAVDLYAGIGYFTFSYLKAGVDKVICWDLNPWSIEGLRRGAAANKWSSASVSNGESIQNLAMEEQRMLVFCESNERAMERIRSIGHRLPPIRHVNCGLLPTSRGSWQTAFQILDRQLGGWIHIHENFAVNEIEDRAEKVRTTFQAMLKDNGRSGTVKTEHINRLKSYAPGVMHCVIDIYIPPIQSVFRDAHGYKYNEPSQHMCMGVLRLLISNLPKHPPRQHGGDHIEPFPSEAHAPALSILHDFIEQISP